MRDRDHWNPTDEELEKLAEFYRQLDEKLGHPADGDEFRDALEKYVGGLWSEITTKARRQ